jgi:hypothetical protein
MPFAMKGFQFACRDCLRAPDQKLLCGPMQAAPNGSPTAIAANGTPGSVKAKQTPSVGKSSPKP